MPDDLSYLDFIRGLDKEKSAEIDSRVVNSSRNSLSIRRTLTISDELVYRNNPSTIIILDSRNRSLDIHDLDRMHRGLGMKMFGYHYYIDTRGIIYAGRPERAFACDVAVLNRQLHRNLTNDNSSPFDDLVLEVDSAANVISSGRIFICLEGNTDKSHMTLSQRLSLVALASNIKSRNRNLRGIYSLSEIIPEFDNLGAYVDMNSLRADINSDIAPLYVETPAGSITYTYGGRQLSYNPDFPLSGNDVKLVQLYLEALGFKVKDSAGVYNLFTYNAVKAFQKASGLSINGIMEGELFGILQEKVRTLSELKDYSQFHRLIRYREKVPMEGSDIVRLNRKLERIGYYKGESKINTFTLNSQEAVKEFQVDNGLEPDGVVGPITWKMIMDSEENGWSRELRYNPDGPMMYGEDVRIIQKKIKMIAKRFGLSATPINGEYDKQTYDNIRRIQSQINFPIDGVVDHRMYHFLYTKEIANELAGQ